MASHSSAVQLSLMRRFDYFKRLDFDNGSMCDVSEVEQFLRVTWCNIQFILFQRDTLQASYLTIRAGSSSDRAGGQIYNVTKFIMHEKFDRYVHDYDYALVHLKEPITFDATMQAIKLHEFGQDLSVGTIVQGSGWSSSDDNPNLLLRRGKRFATIFVKFKICSFKCDQSSSSIANRQSKSLYWLESWTQTPDDRCRSKERRQTYMRRYDMIPRL